MAATKSKGAAANGSPPKPAARKNGTAKQPTRAQAEKAIAEMRDKPRSGDFRGIALTLPAQLPATFIFDVAEMQAEDDETDFAVVHNMMVGLLGREQWGAVRRKIGADGDSMSDLNPLLEEIFQSVTGAYGVELGESPASDIS